MTEEEFREAVRTDARAREHKRIGWLREEAALDRWRDVLVAEKAHIEGMFAERKAAIESLRQECIAEGNAGKARFFGEHARYLEWKASAIWAARCYVSRLQECNRLRHQRAQAADANKRMRTVDLLEKAARLIPATSEEGRQWHADWETWRRAGREALDGCYEKAETP